MIGDVVCQRSVHVGVVTRLSPCGAHFQEVYHVVFQRGEHIGQDDGRVDSSVEETVVVDGQCRRPVVASGKVDKPEILIPEFHLCEGSDCSAQIAVIGADGLVGPVLQIVPSFHEQPFEKRLQIRRFPLVEVPSCRTSESDVCADIVVGAQEEGCVDLVVIIGTFGISTLFFGFASDAAVGIVGVRQFRRAQLLAGVGEVTSETSYGLQTGNDLVRQFQFTVDAVVLIVVLIVGEYPVRVLRVPRVIVVSVEPFVVEILHDRIVDVHRVLYQFLLHGGSRVSLSGGGFRHVFADIRDAGVGGELAEFHVATERQGVTFVFVGIVGQHAVRGGVAVRKHQAHLFVAGADADVVVHLESGGVEVAEIVFHERVVLFHRGSQFAGAPFVESAVQCRSPRSVLASVPRSPSLSELVLFLRHAEHVGSHERAVVRNGQFLLFGAFGGDHHYTVGGARAVEGGG